MEADDGSVTAVIGHMLCDPGCEDPNAKGCPTEGTKHPCKALVPAGTTVTLGQRLGSVGPSKSVQNGGPKAHTHISLYYGPYVNGFYYGFVGMGSPLCHFARPETLFAGVCAGIPDFPDDWVVGETCNNRDDNENGFVDEGLLSDACAHSPGAWLPHAPGGGGCRSGAVVANRKVCAGECMYPGCEAAQKAITDKYRSSDEKTRGIPFDDGGGLAIHRWSGPGGRIAYAMCSWAVSIQNFASELVCNSTLGGDWAIIHNEVSGGAFIVREGFWGTYKCIRSTDGWSGGPQVLGPPIEDAVAKDPTKRLDDACGVHADGSGRLVDYQRFRYGCLWWGPDEKSVTSRMHVHLTRKDRSITIDDGSTGACAGLAVAPNPPGPAPCSSLPCEFGSAPKCGDAGMLLVCGDKDSDGCPDVLEMRCASGTVCAKDYCRVCGAAGQPCCSGGVCGSSLGCSDGVCVTSPLTCGSNGQPCCTYGVSCFSGTVCVGGACKSGSVPDAGSDSSADADASISDAAIDTGPDATMCTDACTEPAGTWTCNSETEEYNCIYDGACKTKASVGPCGSGKACVVGLGCRPCGAAGDPCCASKTCTTGGTCGLDGKCTAAPVDSGTVDTSFGDTGSTTTDTGIDSTFGDTSTDSSVTDTSDAPGPTILQLTLGAYHGCALRVDGVVLCWGYNNYGQLGDGTTAWRTSSAPVSDLSAVAEVSTRGDHVCARKTDGTVACWGWNGYGGLGDGTNTNRSTPLVITGLSGVAKIAAGIRHTCALKTDTTVACWGSNSSGQLGDGTATDRWSPVTVVGLSGVAELALGPLHTCARKTDGTVACWGANGGGLLGDGTTTDRWSPTPVLGLASVSGITASSSQAWTCARRTDGAAYCWGTNFYGQLGDGSTTNRSAPTLVAGLAGVAGISAGDMHSCAMKSDGSPYCWGMNGAGRLGDGTSTNRAFPTLVSGLTGVVEIVAGGAHSCARLSDGSVRCWGANASGQLCDGTTTARPTPVAVVW